MSCSLHEELQSSKSEIEKQYMETCNLEKLTKILNVIKNDFQELI